jgi:hypothetical protein
LRGKEKNQSGEINHLSRHLMATVDNDENDIGRPPLYSWDEKEQVTSETRHAYKSSLILDSREIAGEFHCIEKRHTHTAFVQKEKSMTRQTRKTHDSNDKRAARE